MDLGARTAAALFVVALTVVAFANLGDCAHKGARPDARCPGTSQQDQARLTRLLALLLESDEGGALVRRGGAGARVCFGDYQEGVVTGDGVVLLPKAQDDAAQAARLAHLLLHRLEGVPFADLGDRRPCPSRVAAALRAEARAHAVELRLRRALAARGRLFPMEVESAFWAAPGHARTELLLRHLSRPGPGSLADAYARRCRDESSGAAALPQSNLR